MSASAAAVASTAPTTAAAAKEEQGELDAKLLMAAYPRANAWASVLEKSIREFRDSTGRARQIAEMRRRLRSSGIVDEHRLPEGVRWGKLIEAIQVAERASKRIREAGDSVYRIVYGERDVPDADAACARGAGSGGKCPEYGRREAGTMHDIKEAREGQVRR